MSALITAIVALLCAAPSVQAVKLINVEDLTREGKPLPSALQSILYIQLLSGWACSLVHWHMFGCCNASICWVSPCALGRTV